MTLVSLRIYLLKEKRLIVLDEMSKAFQPNKEYTEREVNIIIADFHDDFCSIRREMIGEGILSRKNAIYKFVQNQ